MQLLTLGCDPGLGGAIALLDSGQHPPRVQTADMPTHQIEKGGKARRVLDLHGLGALLAAFGANGIALACVEDLSGRPVLVRNAKGETRVQGGQWALGWNCCAPVMGCAALAIPYELVRPVDWKRRLGVPADKDGARARASQMFPADAGQFARVKDDGRAEAALLAYYAALRCAAGGQL
jgi:crossover junction endodeoxyribonuclease RuvC